MNSPTSVIAQLLVLGKIQPGQHINTYQGVLTLGVVGHSVTDGVRRWCYGESRAFNMRIVTTVVTLGIAFLSQPLDGATKNSLREALRLAAEGLRNYYSTYPEDTRFQADIDVLLLQISTALDPTPDTLLRIHERRHSSESAPEPPPPDDDVMPV